MRLRALPVILFAGTLLLSVRVGGLWHDLSIEAGDATAAQTKSAAAPSTPAAPEAGAAPAMAAPAATRSSW